MKIDIGYIEQAAVEEGFIFELKEYNFLPEESLLEIPSIQSSKADEFIKKAEEGSIFHLLSSRLLIKYLSTIIEKNKEQKSATALVFSNKGITTNAYGNKEEQKLLQGEGEFIKINGKKVKHNLFPFKGKFKISVSSSPIEKEVYGCEEERGHNLSLLEVVMAKDEENTYGWKKENFMSFSNPLLSLAYAIKKFKNLGAVIIENKIYPNPELMVNEGIIKELIEKEKNKVRKLYLNEELQMLKRVKNSFIYLMNLNGKVKEYNEKLMNKERWINKEVIIGNDIFEKIKNVISKDLDYYKIEGIRIGKLGTIIQALANNNITDEITLKYTENSLNTQANIKRVLREITTEKFRLGDIKIRYKIKKQQIEVTYSRSCKPQSFLTFSERYLITKTRKGNLIMVF